MAHSSSPLSEHGYGGDSRLAGLLAAHRTGKSVAEVRGIVEGVLAAPDGIEPDGWMEMVTAAPEQALRDQLAALKATMAAAGCDGLDSVPPAPAWRLRALRRELAARGLDGFVVPHADEHQGEQLPARTERLRWLTGFAGSAGTAVVLPRSAAIFVDGRYTLQAQVQVSADAFERRHVPDEPFTDWIRENLDGGRLGYDPWLHVASDVAKLTEAAEAAGGALVACDINPVDVVWSNQPARPLSPLRRHLLEHAGQPASEKVARVAAVLADNGQGAVILSDPASLAWLFNIRGGDIPGTPVGLGFAIVEASGKAALFTEPCKATVAVRDWLPDGVKVMARESLADAVDRVSANGGKVLVDSRTGASWFASRIAAAGGVAVDGDDPCALPRACKNAVEIAGARAAHVRDGAALTGFLAWLDRATAPGSNVEVDELAAEDRLAEFRSRADGYLGFSFEDHLRRRSPTAPWSTTVQVRRPTAAWNRARSISSIPAASIATARRT